MKKLLKQNLYDNVKQDKSPQIATYATIWSSSRWTALDSSVRLLKAAKQPFIIIFMYISISVKTYNHLGVQDSQS